MVVPAQHSRDNEMQDAASRSEHHASAIKSTLSFSNGALKVVCSDNAICESEGNRFGVANKIHFVNDSEASSFLLAGRTVSCSSENQAAHDCLTITSHYRNIKQRHKNQPVYYLFVAPGLHPLLAAHLFNLNRFDNARYFGQTNFLPLTSCQFQKLIFKVSNGQDDVAQLKGLMDLLVQDGRVSSGEKIWLREIERELGN